MIWFSFIVCLLMLFILVVGFTYGLSESLGG